MLFTPWIWSVLILLFSDQENQPCGKVTHQPCSLLQYLKTLKRGNYSAWHVTNMKYVEAIQEAPWGAWKSYWLDTQEIWSYKDMGSIMIGVKALLGWQASMQWLSSLLNIPKWRRSTNQVGRLIWHLRCNARMMYISWCFATVHIRQSGYTTTLLFTHVNVIDPTLDHLLKSYLSCWDFSSKWLQSEIHKSKSLMMFYCLPKPHAK